MAMSRVKTAFSTFRREVKKGNAYAAAWFLRRFYYRFVKPHFDPCGPNGQTGPGQALTVVVPAIEKDSPVLRHCLRSIREMIKDNVTEVWIVAPESVRIREVAAAEKCKFIMEDDILPRPAAELKCRGWVLQQFIKFNAANFIRTPDYLVVDADTVFLRPQYFFRGGRAGLRYADQYELLYNRSLELVFGHPLRFPVSFVTHHMLFNVEQVRQLLKMIEDRFGLPWWEAVLKEMDQGHPISFSEYELYGHFILSQSDWRQRFYLEHWRGLDRDTRDLEDLSKIREKAAGRLNCVSFHWHTQ